MDKLGSWRAELTTDRASLYSAWGGAVGGPASSTPLSSRVPPATLPGNSPARPRAADLMPSRCRVLVGRDPGSGRPTPAGPPLQKPAVSGGHGPRRSQPDPFAPKARRPAAAAMAARDAPGSDAAELDAKDRGLWALRGARERAGPLRFDRSG